MTYRGGPSVSSWRAIGMKTRSIDPGFRGDPPASDLDYFVLPPMIADVYTAKVIGESNVLIDYYVEMEDQKGHVSKSEIQHVWVD